MPLTHVLLAVAILLVPLTGENLPTLPSRSRSQGSRERKRPRKTKIMGRLLTWRVIMCTRSKAKSQRSSSPGWIMLKVNFKLGKRCVHALSTTMASYKGLCSWVIARGRGNTVSAAPATATQLVCFAVTVSWSSVSVECDTSTCAVLCLCVQFRMKESGVAEIVKSETVVTASQSSRSISSAPVISSAVKSSNQNGMDYGHFGVLSFR